MAFWRSFLLATLFIAVSASASAEKLKVDLYAESLCPYCRRFILNTIKPLYENGLGEAMDFTPYYAGNARIVSGKLVCQHGKDECYLNRVINCGIAKSNGISQWLPFVECIEQDADRARYSEAVIDHCCKKAGLNFEPVKTCYNGDEGEKLHRAAYDVTMTLKPPKRYVPWVVVNGVPLYDDMLALPRMLCVQTSAAERPKMCYEEGMMLGLDRSNALGEQTCPDDTQAVV